MDPLKDFEIPEQADASMQAKAAVPSPDAGGDLIPGFPNPTNSRTPSSGVNRTVQHDPAQEDGYPDDRSNVGSDSSEEVILFKGRNAGRQQQQSPSPKPIGGGNGSIDAASPHEINLELRFTKESTDVTFKSKSISKVDGAGFISLNTNHPKRPSSRDRARIRTGTRTMKKPPSSLTT